MPPKSANGNSRLQASRRRAKAGRRSEKGRKAPVRFASVPDDYPPAESAFLRKA